jgi:hypothetical protein
MYKTPAAAGLTRVSKSLTRSRAESSYLLLMSYYLNFKAGAIARHPGGRLAHAKGRSILRYGF